MPDYKSTVDTAAEWGLSKRRVATLCEEGRIPGAFKLGSGWIIPADAEKPADARIKSGKYIKDKNPYSDVAPDDYAGIFKKLLHSPELVFQLFNTLPFPVEIFAPDGTAVYINRALMVFLRQSDATATVGKFNILNDPASDAIFGHNTLEKMMRGESVVVRDFSVPVQDQLNKGVSDEKPFKAAYMDVHSVPVWDGDKLAYVVCVFIPKQVYQGREEMIEAQRYIEENWLEPFDLEKTAKAVHLSVSHFSRLFKQETNLTPQDYYVQVKVGKIKEKLGDPNLNITQAFAECGVDSKGIYFQHFKERVNMTPSEYREQNKAKE